MLACAFSGCTTLQAASNNSSNDNNPAAIPATSSQQSTEYVSTFIGSDFRFADGNAKDALFYKPQGIAIDKDGNILVADTLNRKIRKVSKNGIVSTIAGSTYGHEDGPSLQSKFENPVAVAIDTSSNIYVADHVTIRKIGIDGTVSTLAGSTPGSKDGIGPEANFSYLSAIACDKDGNVYVCDRGNVEIRRVSPNGLVQTLVGSKLKYDPTKTGVVLVENLNIPTDIAVTDLGSVFFTDAQRLLRSLYLNKVYVHGPADYVSTGPNNNVYAYLSDGHYWLINKPSELIKLPENWIYPRVDSSGGISGLQNHSIYKWQYSEKTLVAGSEAPNFDGPNNVGRLGQPSDLDITGNGEVIFIDQELNAIRKITKDKVLKTIASVSTAPFGLKVSKDGTIYFVDGARVKKIQDGIIVKLTDGGSGYQDGIAQAAKFNAWDIDFDQEGNLYVADGSNACIRKIDVSGLVTTVTKRLESSDRLSLPTGIAISSKGDIFVADSTQNQILHINKDGTVSTFAGSSSGFSDGQGKSAMFNKPTKITFDNEGFILVCDTGNHKIRRISPTGQVTTLAGTEKGFRDGSRDFAQFDSPKGVAVDAQGNYFVSDANNHRIRTIAGTGTP